MKRIRFHSGKKTKTRWLPFLYSVLPLSVKKNKIKNETLFTLFWSSSPGIWNLKMFSQFLHFFNRFFFLISGKIDEQDFFLNATRFKDFIRSRAPPFFLLSQKDFFFVAYNWINAYMKFSAFFMKCLSQLTPTDNRNNCQSIIITITPMKKKQQ